MDYLLRDGWKVLALVYLFYYLLCAIPKSIYLFTLGKTLKLVQPHNRAMKPGQVWLAMIPLFSYVWSFFLATRVAESIQRELDDVDFSFEEMSSGPSTTKGSAPTRDIGLAYAICYACFWIPFVSLLTNLAGFVCWIIHWVQVSQQQSLLERRRWQQELSKTPSHL